MKQAFIKIFSLAPLLLCGFFISAGPTFLFSQQFILDSNPSSNSLSANSVHALLRDREGFLWIGTQNGLNRYDGEKYTLFSHHPDDSTTLSDNFVVSLAEDSFGNIWIGTRHGLNRFDKKRQSFQRFYLLDFTLNPTHQTVLNLSRTINGAVVLMCGGTLFITSLQEPFRVNPHLAADTVSSVISDSTGTLFVGKHGAIVSIDPAERRIYYRFNQEILPSALLLDRGRLIVGTDNGLYLFSPGDHRDSIVNQPTFLLKGISIYSLAVDIKQRLWIGTDNGIYLYENDKLIGHIRENIEDSGGLQSSSVRTLLSDATGIMWIGLLRGGVQRYDPLKERFLTIEKLSHEKIGVVWSTVTDQRGFLWMGTHNGLYRFHPSDTLYQFPREMFPAVFHNTMIGTLKVDLDGNLWIGTKKRNVYCYRPATNTLHTYPLFGRTIENKPVSVADILQLQDGFLWVATTNGIYQFNEQHQQFDSLTLPAPPRNGENYFFMQLHQGRSGTVWISSSHGLYRIHPHRSNLTLYKNIIGDSLSLSSNIVSACLEDSKGRIWVSTFGGGINEFHPASETFTRYDSFDGLADNVVYGIIEDSHGRLWMSTDNGLSCFEPETQRFFTVGSEEGLTFLEFSQNAFYLHNSGKMFFGGIGGMVMFQPDDITFPDDENPIIVTDIRINYQSIDPSHEILSKGTLTSPEEIHLTYDQKTISIDFASMNFRAKEKLKYSYQLMGFFNHWVHPVSRIKTAHYTHLSAGEYMFLVRTSSQPSTWNPNELRIKLIVQPPFWATWWFLLFTSLAFLGVVVASVRFVYQRKLLRHLQELELQKKVHAERERISRDLHDSTGANLASIISGLDVAEKYLSSSSVKTKKTLRSLTEDARLSMSQLRETIWAMKTNEMTLASFAEAVKENINRQLRYNKKVKFSMIVNGNDQIRFSPAQVLNLFRIIQESVANMLKHSTAKQFDVRMKSADGWIQVIVENDGRRKKTSQASMMHGHGIANMERRAAELGGTLQIQFGETQGCRVTVSIPLNK